MVSSSFTDYSNCFLFSLCLQLNVEVLQLDLCQQGSDAAFLLSTLYGEPESEAMQLDASAKEHADSADLDKTDLKAVGFAWEEQLYQLPQVLEILWERSSQGTKLDHRSFLEHLPKFTTLPTRPRTNNYRNDSSKLADKCLKVSQQMLLNVLRGLSAVVALQDEARRPREQPETRESSEAGEELDSEQLQLQLFQYVADCYHKLEQDRKEHSLPGSTSVEEGLFGQEELKTMRLRQTVNRQFTSSMLQGPQVRGLWPLTSKSFRTESSAFRWSKPSVFGKAGFKGGKGGFRGGFGGYRGWQSNFGRGKSKGMFSFQKASIFFPSSPLQESNEPVWPSIKSIKPVWQQARPLWPVKGTD